MTQATQTLSTNQLQREIRKLEQELATLKRTNLWKIDRRVSQLLAIIDDSPKSLEKSRLRNQVLAIAATALISFNLANSQDYTPNFDWFKPSVEQVQETATQPEVKPEVKPETLETEGKPTLSPFAQKIKQVAANINADPIDLATLISFETAGTFSPSIRGPVVKGRGRAVGLIQFMPGTAAELGTTSEALAQMSQVEQMDYVERYLVKRGFRGGTLKQLYSTVFAGHPNARGSISDGYHTLDSAVERMTREHRERAIALLSGKLSEKTPDQINKSHIYKWDVKFQKNPQLGDIIAGYKVTSPRGWRIHPISGKRQYHQGVDLATPAGTPLYAIADGWVECARGDAAGLYATFTSEEFPTLQFKLLHLSRCLVEPGQKTKVSRKKVIGWTGNSGGSTGPHLDLRIKSSSSGNWLRVRAGWLQWFLTGEQP
ncbi:peptidoglycan DD-metalloendopeptidase family protein [Coleofasciculus sp.]|uniref:peptidoglycan DD-metalloendopeptidase family protein n=1 Tax=Coleofasciculus sp. TaxID=3100458 RepID=UPI003A2097A0